MMNEDTQGQPVAQAKVSFGHEEDPANETRPESHQFGWVQVAADSDGRWRIHRIAEDTLKTLHGGAEHPDYVRSLSLSVGGQAEAERKLREGTFVFQLRSAVTARGIVVDSQDQSISEATVLVGNLGESGSRQTKTLADGTFEVAGCKPGETLLTAEASGYSPATLKVNLAENSEPFLLMLKSGNLLRLRVVNKSGQPIPKASIWLNTLAHGPINSNTSAPYSAGRV